MKTRQVTTICLLAMLALHVAAIGNAAAQSPANVTTANSPSPKADPVMTEELMASLIKYTRDVKGTGGLGARLGKILNLCDGTKDMPLKLATSDLLPGLHCFGLPVDPDSKDILIMVQPDKQHCQVYLTDKTAKLRAAAVEENGNPRLITNEQAERKFKAELAIFAKEAADLPPTEPAVPATK